MSGKKKSGEGLRKVSPKKPGSNAHDRKRLVVQVEDRANDRWIRCVALLPEPVAHDGHRWSVRPIVGGSEHSARISADAEHPEVIARDKLAGIALGSVRVACAADAKYRREVLECSQVGKAFCVVAEIFVEIVGDDAPLVFLAEPVHVAAV